MQVNYLVVLLLGIGLAQAQTAPTHEQRITELEQKMRLLDPAFASTSAANLTQRLEALEKRMGELLRDRPAAATAPSAGPPSALQPAAAPITPVSVSGDFQTSGGGETR